MLMLQYVHTILLPSLLIHQVREDGISSYNEHTTYSFHYRVVVFLSTRYSRL